MDRKTVRRYFAVLEELGVGRDVELDDALVHQVGSRVQARAVPEPSSERVLLMEHRNRIEAWLTQKRPLKLTKIHTMLARDHGLDVSYATLRRFALSTPTAPRVRLRWPPWARGGVACLSAFRLVVRYSAVSTHALAIASSRDGRSGVRERTEPRQDSEASHEADQEA